MYNFYLGITYRTVGKITPPPAGVKSFGARMTRILNPDFIRVDVTQVRMYKFLPDGR